LFDKYLIRKYLEGSCLGIIQGLHEKFPGDTDEIHENAARIACIEPDIRKCNLVYATIGRLGHKNLLGEHRCLFKQNKTVVEVGTGVIACTVKWRRRR
jgi:hypothetical protein